MLLQRDASVNLQDSDGCTALMGAASDGHTTIVQALLDAKADASLQAVNGFTALIMAKRHTATAQLLRQHTKRQMAAAEAGAATSAAHATAAADAMAATLLGEEAAEKEAGAKGKGKKKKTKAATSTATAEPVAAAQLASAPAPAVEAEAAVMHAAATAPTPSLSGRRVRIFSLKPTP